ncbi:MAG: hypothetical protein H0W50_11340 [Parachlamydiaceae bacterium]|nr:hypothetical protein [Parachlamydiaceae bacterium]
MKELNPKVNLQQSTNEAPIVSIENSNELLIEQCSQQFKGFSGLLAFPKQRPLTQINFNGTTLQVIPVNTKNEIMESYVIVGDSPFQKLKLQIYQQNEHSYCCIDDGASEVWSFGKIKEVDFPTVTSSELLKKFKASLGDYIDTSLGGPPPRQIGIDKDGMTISFPNTTPSHCLITAVSDSEVKFLACLDGGPQCYSYKLVKELAEWKLMILNGETEDLIFNLSKRKG